MPLYDYQCAKCSETWDEFKRMDDRKDPESLPCPKCGAVGEVKQTIVFTTMMVSATLEADRAINKLNRSSKLKEKIQHIHDTTPGSILNKTSRILDIK